MSLSIPNSLPIKETMEVLKFIQNNKLKCSISLAIVLCLMYSNPLRHRQNSQNFTACHVSKQDSIIVVPEGELVPEMISSMLNTAPSTTPFGESPTYSFVYAMEHLIDRDLCQNCIRSALDRLIQDESSTMAKLALQDCQQILANENTLRTRTKVAKRLRRMGLDTSISCAHPVVGAPRELFVPQPATSWPLTWTNQLWQDWSPTTTTTL